MGDRPAWLHGTVYHPRRGRDDFPATVQDLIWNLLAWLEALLAHEGTVLPGSVTFQYPPNNWSKYKLIPFDEARDTPVRGAGEGVAVCLDGDACQHAGGAHFQNGYPLLRWLEESLTVQVGSGVRTYRAVLFSVQQHAEDRVAALRQLAEVIRRLEQAPPVA